MSHDHHVVIVGGGFGGLATAQGLGDAAGIRVTLVDRRNYHLFQPLLYQVATAVLSPGEVAQPIRSILRRHRNVTVLLREAEGVDVSARTLSLRGGRQLSYDTLVLATGATHSYFGHPEWANVAPGLKTLDDARRIRSTVLRAFEDAERSEDPAARERCLTFIVIGGGPTGVEMAGAIAGLARQALTGEFRNIDPGQARVLLIEAGPRILAPFPEALSSYATEALRKLGVTVMTGKPVERIDEHGVVADGTPIPAAAVIWGAGVQASSAGQWLGVRTERSGHVRVGSDLAVTGLQGVYVIGDTALFVGRDGKPLPGLAQVAQQQGQYLGRPCGAESCGGTSGSVPVPKPGKSGRNRSQCGGRSMGQRTAQGVPRLCVLGGGACLPPCRIPEPAHRHPALALDIRHQAARLPDNP